VPLAPNPLIWTPSQDQDESEGDGEQERLQSYIRHHE
jgi:hypothetical protein